MQTNRTPRPFPSPRASILPEALERRALFNAAGVEQIVWHGKPATARDGEVIVDFGEGRRRGGAFDATRRAAQIDALQDAINGALAGRGAGVTVAKHLGGDGMMLVRGAAGSDAADLARRLDDIDGVRATVPNFIRSVQRMPNDPQFGSTWGLHNAADADIDAPEAWDITVGSANVVVGVIDTGIDYEHPDLAPNMWTNPGEVAGNNIDDDANGYVDDVHGIDALNDDADPMDDQGHGTHCAGTIAARGDDGAGVAGVSWNAKLMALKFIGPDGYGTDADAIECMNYATMMRQTNRANVRVTNNSYGGDPYDPVMHAAIQQHANAGILFVAAAGNENNDNDVGAHYPSNYDVDGVVSVAASVESNDGRASFSNYGATSVDLAAPGEDIYSTARGGGYVRMSGTSMATPHVAGAAALVAAIRADLSPAQMKAVLMNSVDTSAQWQGVVASGGRLNAHKALVAARQPGIYGKVIVDADADSAVDAAERAHGAAGQTVYADLDLDGTRDAHEPTSVTDAAGNYALTDLGTGWKKVRLVTAPGWRSTYRVDYDVQLAAGQVRENVDFLATRAVVVRGVAYHDANANGTRDAGEQGLAGRTVFADLDGNGVAGHATRTHDRAAPVVIPDDGGEHWVEQSIVVSDLPARLADVNVRVDIDHGWAEDLRVELVAPDGRVVKLTDGHGGGEDDYANTVFDDEAAGSIGDASPPFAGSFRPDAPLSALDGMMANGTWTLRVCDEGWGVDGTLKSWGLTLAAVEPSATTNASGAYTLALPPDAAYTLKQAGTVGWVSTAGPLVVAPQSGTVLDDRDFGSRPFGGANAPSVTASSFLFETFHGLRVTFSQDVGASLALSDLKLVNVTTGADVTGRVAGFAYDAATRTATFGFAGVLPDGGYQAKLRAADVRGPDGTPMTADHATTFHVLAGDANRDARVDFQDLSIVASNYGKQGRTFSQGNFDYSTDGAVTFGDVSIVAARYGQFLLPPQEEAEALPRVAADVVA